MRDIDTEIQTVNIMIQMYCKGNHEGPHPCPECRELMEYCEKHTRNCPRGEQKGNCDACTIHCYKPEMRQKIRAAMRYSGPRMIFTHPVMAVRHLRHKIAAKKAAKREASRKSTKEQII